MMGHWIHPAFGWALLALLIPLAIHLWNRKQGRVIKVGSIQLHRPTETARASRLYLHEIALWLLRSALVASLVALLVGWQYPPSTPTKSGTWKVLDPAAASDLEGISLDSSQVRWLAPGFPTLAEMPIPPKSTGPAWPSLLAITDLSEQPDTVEVMTHLTTNRWPEPSPNVPVAVQWLPLPRRQTPENLVQAWQTTTKSREWWANTEEFTVTLSEKQGSEKAASAPEWKVYIEAEPQDQVTMEAALRLCAAYVEVSLSWVDDPDSANVAFLLDGASALETEALQIVYSPQPSAYTWWSPDPVATNRIRWHHLPRLGEVSDRQWRELPLALLDLLLHQPALELPIPPHHLVVPPAVNESKIPGDTARTELLFLIIGLLVAERLMATWRKA